jgi:hypothetical protein
LIASSGRLERGRIGEIQPDFIGSHGRHPHEKRRYSFEKFACQLTLSITAQVLLSLPTGNPDNFVAVLQHLIENAALVLLDALSEVVEDLPRLSALPCWISP